MTMHRSRWIADAAVRACQRRGAGVGMLLLLIGGGAGCLRERSIPMTPGAFRPLTPAALDHADGSPAQGSPAPRALAADSLAEDAGRSALGAAAPALTSREWLARAHAELRDLLPPLVRPALLTDDLVDAQGQAVNVPAHFGLFAPLLDSFFFNPAAMTYSAQATGAGPAIDEPAPPWPSFEDVWIPIDERLQLSARVGWAQRDGQRVRADCVILLPGLLGDNAVKRTRDLGQALRSHGLHVLALELRGHGQTEARYPDAGYGFGTLEVGDLLVVSAWLRAQPLVRETGLVGFCWSANLALLAAWEDARRDDDPIIAERLRPYLRPRSGGPHFCAGVLAFSPTIRFEEIMEKLERPISIADKPMLDALQKVVRRREAQRAYAEQEGNLRRLIERELARSDASYAGAIDDGLQYLRLLPHRGKPSGDKLSQVRVPVTIVHGADDPMAHAQSVADLIAATPNANVAAIILPGGGHVGFWPYAPRYAYSLLLNYFDPQAGAAAAASRVCR